ncbi:MAG: hypothetical protein A3F72_03545 [Bacteroidetes bacterium RIFCSPLOWO2_12_FULL_35_15]|nr:MAG: hypothetical protein A3F72_03545 [Bacteroidetes bacterium RIFCSPLOWO2_12_FULL_35_15]
MQIEKLIIKGLYGYIDKDIDFNKDITLLVGINGSGKTSILNIINWLIKPSIPNLCVTEFELIELTLKFKGTTYLITCKHIKSILNYIVSTEKETYHPLIVRIKTPPKNIKNDEQLKASLFQDYSSLKPDTKEKKTWDLISNFPNPTIIGLDRNIYTEEAERVYFEESIRGNNFKKKIGPNVSPLERVKEIVNKEYRKKKNAILNLTTNLKTHLMLSTFESGITLEAFNSGIRQKLNIAQISAAEQRVNDYFLKFETKSFLKSEQETVTKFFYHLKDITSKYIENSKDERVKFLYGLNASQFVKVNKLLKEFVKFETESSKALANIYLYIHTLNYFLKDSAKQLIFNEETSELSFNTLDKNGNVITEYRDIKFLSSGEQQILILFSYISFNSSDGQVFIIDEPELSLHIKWQEDFLEKLELVKPKTTQLILATHSPILANKKKQNAKLLLPYNL